MSELRGREFKIIIAVLLLSGSFLFFGNVKNSSAILLNRYDKLYNGTLTAQEWNNLASDFLKTYGPVSMTGPLGVGTTTIPGSGILVDGPIIASNFSGFFTGGIDAANVMGGNGSIFGSTFGSGASYSFSGNVGIGTSSPGAKLDVIGSLRASSATITSVNSGVVMADESGNLYATSSAVATGIPVGSNGQTLRSNGTNWLANSLLFNNGTNIGIGTTNPLAKLDVYSQSGTDDIVYRAGKSGVNTESTFWGFNVTGDNTAFIGSQYAGATNRFGIRVGGLTSTSEKLSVLQTGNVGIGTTNPGSQLEIVGAAGTGAPTNSAGMISVLSTGGGNDGGGIIFGSSNQKAGFAGIKGSLIDGDGLGHTSGDLVFYTRRTRLDASQTEAMRILSNGNVGIGTTAPSDKLEVVGNLRLTTGGDFSNLSFYSTGNGVQERARIMGTADGVTYNTGELAFYTKTAVGALTEQLRINKNGNVGIGTTAPDATLDIGGAIASFRANSATLSNIGSGVIMADASGNLYSTSTAAATGMPSPSGIAGQTLRSNGTNWIANSLLFNDGTNVGIGTTNPTVPLEVQGTFRFQTPSAAGYGELYSDGGGSIFRSNGHLSFWTNNAAYDTYFKNANGASTNVIIKDNGNVGIGTTNPGTTLDVGGATGSFRAKSGTLSNIGGGIIMADGSGNLYSTSSLAAITAGWTVDGTTVYKTDINGNVGIGTSAPVGNLSVMNPPNGYGVLSTTAIDIGTNLEAGNNSSGKKYTDLNFRGHANTINAKIRSWDEAQSTGWGVLTLSTFSGSTLNEAMRIDHLGNVGIGTTNPQTKLDIANAQGNGIQMTYDTTQTYRAWIRPYWNSASDSRMDFAVSASGVTPTTIMSLNSLGNVGIGTTNPGTTLDVGGATGSFRAKSGTLSNIGGGIIMADGSGNLYSTSSLAAITAGWTVDGTTVYKTDINGNVGIGTTNPGSKLDVYGEIRAMNVGGDGVLGTAITFGNSGYPATQNHRVRTSTSAAANSNLLSFETSNGTVGQWNTNQLVLNGTGNVGIGTTVPGATLDIGGAVASFRAKSATLSNIGSGVIMADASGNLYSTTTAAATGIPSPAGISGQTLRSNGTSWIANDLLFNDGTNVGVGTTTATYKLEVDGSFSATSNASSIILDASGNISIGI